MLMASSNWCMRTLMTADAKSSRMRGSLNYTQRERQAGGGREIETGREREGEQERERQADGGRESDRQMEVERETGRATGRKRE